MSETIRSDRRTEVWRCGVCGVDLNPSEVVAHNATCEKPRMSETPEYTIRNGDNGTVAAKLRVLADAIETCDEDCGLLVDGYGAGQIGLTIQAPIELAELLLP